ncbi:putative bifunctional diguanylate cyclase/phosphodiesterase [Plasticicumulans acidivorans]|uniref:Diguanylate cyclase (GGDEF)-like protein n=1 Tax=Plasticicumulans acidivorans TaxID=886464 RepID=A0A317MYL2_9GAMM|nr:EAL domain-containing protein [Plasticicumulans acidivorans]PWV60601.1 diguanylate cyclase (GGDEF)-like protein [Plasticicumulans acidivorans]
MNRWSLWRALGTRLVVASLLVELLMLALLVCNAWRVTEEGLLEQSRLRMQEVGTLLAAALAAPLAERDYVTLQELLDAVRRRDGLSYLVLLDADGRQVAAAGWNTQEALPPVADNAQLDHRYGARFDGRRVLELAGQRLGELHFGVDLGFLHQLRARLLSQSVLIATLEMFASTLLLGLIGYWLTRRLHALSTLSEALADGGQAQRAAEGEDEVGRLGRAFNRMADAIAVRIVELEAARDQSRRFLAHTQTESARLAAVLGAVRRGLLFTEGDGRIVFVNAAWRRMWGVDEQSGLVGRPLGEVFAYCARWLSDPTQLQFSAGERCGDERELRCTDGRIVVVRCETVHDAAGSGLLWIFEDVTRERETAERLLYLAERDTLTGLYNRHRFASALEGMLRTVERRGGSGALLYFDLDNFKQINDGFGHHAGDDVLQRVAREVGRLVRADETLARLGGDEFALIVTGAGENEASVLAERIVNAIGRLPCVCAGQPVRLSCSLGIALYPQHAQTASELVVCADAAMYQAKQAGRNAWRLFRLCADAGQVQRERMSWSTRLTRALEREQFRLFFQGIYRARDGHLSHLEVLLRLDDVAPAPPCLPGEFVAAAERSGRITDIDRWVVGTAVRRLATDLALPPLAVNVSARSLQQPGFAGFILHVLALHDVAPRRLLIELTESAVFADIQQARYFIADLQRAGCRVCIDDFGSGFGTFPVLRELGAEVLKINAGLVRNLGSAHDDGCFVRAIVQIARGLERTTVAKGVEDAATLALLRELGVDLVQGFHFGHPAADLPPEQFGGDGH